MRQCKCICAAANPGSNNVFQISPAPKNALPPEHNDVSCDKALVAQIFYNIFPAERLKKLADENLDLLISTKADLRGNILEMTFIFGNNSSLTPIEIEKLEAELKKQVTFIFNVKAFKDWKYVDPFLSVNFPKLVNHAPNAVVLIV